MGGYVSEGGWVCEGGNKREEEGLSGFYVLT